MIECEKCKSIFSRKDALRRHVTSNVCGDKSSALSSYVCSDCKHSWPSTRRYMYDNHVKYRTCQWYMSCPLCVKQIDLRCTRGLDSDVCHDCNHIATKLHHDTRYNPVLQRSFDSEYTYERIDNSKWRTSSHGPAPNRNGLFGNKCTVLLGCSGPAPKWNGLFGNKRTLLGYSGPLEPPTEWISCEYVGPLIQPSRRVEDDVIQLYQLYPVGFDPLRSEQAPPHERLSEPILVDDESLQNAMNEYQRGLFSFCCHSKTWGAIKSHFLKCQSRKAARHLWTRDGPETNEMFKKDVDRYYWWFLSPHSVRTRALLAPNMRLYKERNVPDKQRIFAMMEKMGMNTDRPEPISPTHFIRLSREDRVYLRRVLLDLNHLDRVNNTDSWKLLSPLLWIPNRYRPIGQKVYTPSETCQMDICEKANSEEFERNLRRSVPKGAKVKLPFPSVSKCGLNDRAWEVHPMFSMSGPIRVINRHVFRQSVHGSATMQNQSLRAAEWTCASVQNETMSNWYKFVQAHLVEIQKSFHSISFASGR